MHCLDNFSEMTVDGQALAVCDYMHGSGITINRGGTMRFSSFHDFDIDYKEIETLLDYMIEKDMLIVARRAPGNIINKKEIIREELFTYNNYSGIIPSKLFESG
ncbi:MAG: hypothetical protein GQ477_02140, partial [Nanohaloarchaea archaeon]|nr:hypothetical protein [Candidatus Nanohaloarchaea archaeon]